MRSLSFRLEHHPRWLFLLLAVLLLWGLAGCSATPVTPAETVAVAPQTPSATDTPTSTPEPTATPTPAPLTPSQVFHQVSPSVAYIDTPALRGSGFLIDGGYVVTSAHIVWPFGTVRVVFPNGTEFRDAPVLAWDLVADLAVIGPLDVDLTPLSPIDGESYVIGSNVYLIGYPGEVEDFPQPTISRGLISRKREWDRVGLTYFQTDAAIAGGQSGGVLVSELGEVIGISGFSFAENRFGIVASAADTMPRVKKMIAGEDVDGLHRSPIVKDPGGKTEVTVSLQADWDLATYMFWPAARQEVSLETDAPSLYFQVRDTARNALNDEAGRPVFVTETEFTTQVNAPHFVLVVSSDASQLTGQLTASVPLAPFNDPDNRHPAHLMDQTITAAMDFPGDVDVFPLLLKKGQTIRVHAESAMIDSKILIADAAHSEEPLAGDDNSGGGVFGLDADVSFLAPDDGRYLIIISDSSYNNIGGYFLTIESYQEGAADIPTPVVLTPTPTPIATDLGEMAVFERSFKPRYTFQYPANWKRQRDTPICQTSAGDCFGNTWNRVRYMIVEEDPVLKSLPPEQVLDMLVKVFPDATILERKKITTPSGYDFVMVHLLTKEGFDHIWLAVTQAQGSPVVGIYDMVDIDALQKSGSPDAVTPENIDDQFPGGVEAFEKMVMQSLNSFDVLDR